MTRVNKARFLRTLLFLTAFALLLFVAACGGSSDSGVINNGGGSGGGGETETTDKSSITLTSTANSVEYGHTLPLTATVRDENGSPLSGVVVTFSTASSLVSFDPVSGTALTDNNGEAKITITPSSTSGGAVAITASASIPVSGSSKTLTSAPLGISIGTAAVTIHSLTAGTPAISAYGTTTVNAEIYVGGVIATVPISVTFNSSCTSSGKATISSPVTTINGVATATYKDNGCGLGSDTITANISGGTANTTITVAVPDTNNIQFTSAEPSTIGTSPANSVSLPTSSLVTFRVLDINGSPKSGVGVTFTMLPDNSTLGITYNPSTATSDTNGYVTTSVSSGTVPTPAWVIASVTSKPEIRSQSNTLVITTGLPTQNSFSLSASSYNIEGLNYDGETSTLTIIASDRMGNPIPDQTAISFISEGAQITPAACQTSSGTCSVIFRSADFRPSDGRVTILAHALGEESFIDTNGNNSYDSGESFTDLGIPFIDNNFDGTWQSGENYLPISSSSDSSSCPSGYWSKTNTCNGTWGENSVRKSVEIILSGSTAFIDVDGDGISDTPPLTLDMGSECTKYFTLWLRDRNNNPMPLGTKVETSDNEVYYIPKPTSGEPVLTKAQEVNISSGSPVPSSNSNIGTSITLKIKAGDACLANTPNQYPNGSVNIKVTTPKSNITTIPVTITGNTTTP